MPQRKVAILIPSPEKKEGSPEGPPCGLPAVVIDGCEHIRFFDSGRKSYMI